MKSVQPLAVSFQPSPAEAERTSTFQLDGHRPPLSLEPEGWLVAFVPVSGAPADLLCRQAAICGPAKVTAGPCLRAELPLEKKVDGSFVAMRSALEHGLAVITGRHGATGMEACDREDTKQLLADYAQMHQAPTVPHSDVVAFVLERRLHGRGVGWIDAHLLASALVGHLKLWTTDPRLATVARELGIGYD